MSQTEMKPILSKTTDNQALQALGRASVQIVHDLKNQLNGLKLYATFLRKRLEKSERPADELETINKLISGFDRAAADLSMIVQYGQPLELKRQRGIDLEKIMAGMAKGLNESPRVTGALTGLVLVDSGSEPLVGEFDADSLAEALKSITLSALKMVSNHNREDPLHVRLKSETSEAKKLAVIEWDGFESVDYDPISSFANSDELRMSLAARVIEGHGGSVERRAGTLCVRLPLT
jgi:hypothetical protein